MPPLIKTDLVAWEDELSRLKLLKKKMTVKELYKELGRVRKIKK